MAKSEPYDRTGLANESFELPHISDREGNGKQNVCSRVICYGDTSDLSLTLHIMAIWTDSLGFYPSYFFVDLSNHKGTLFLHRSLSNQGKANDSYFHNSLNSLSESDHLRVTCKQLKLVPLLAESCVFFL